MLGWSNKTRGDSRRALVCRASDNHATKSANTAPVIKDEMARNHRSTYCNILSVHQIYRCTVYVGSVQCPHNKEMLMQSPVVPDNEPLRLDALRRLAILDSPAEERFDRITRMARNMFDVPIALVSLVDENRQWFKSCCGLPVLETPQDISFCGHAILGEELFVVEDAAQDPRFSDNPLVTGGTTHSLLCRPSTRSWERFEAGYIVHHRL